MSPQTALAGLRVLVVEDEYLIVLETVSELTSVGALIVGPLATVDEALSAARTEPLDAAVLDVDLRGRFVFPVAYELEARHIPFVFATSYDPSIIPPQLAHVPLCRKPVESADVVALLGIHRP